MDRRKDQVVLVEQRDSCLVAGRVGRIERQLGEKAFARGVTGCDLLKLDEVGVTGLGILVDPVQMRLVPQAGQFEVGRPVRMAKIRDGTDERCPGFAGARRGRCECKSCNGIGVVSHVIEHPLRRYGTDAGNQVHQSETRDTVARILDET